MNSMNVITELQMNVLTELQMNALTELQMNVLTELQMNALTEFIWSPAFCSVNTTVLGGMPHYKRKNENKCLVR